MYKCIQLEIKFLSLKEYLLMYFLFLFVDPKLFTKLFARTGYPLAYTCSQLCFSKTCVLPTFIVYISVPLLLAHVVDFCRRGTE